MRGTKEVAVEIGVSISQINNMLGHGIPDHFKPKKQRREGARNESFVYKDHHIDILKRAFNLKKYMTYKEVKEDLSQILAKECYTCKDVYPLSRDYWHYDSNRVDGFDGRCIDCKNEYNRSRISKTKNLGISNLMELDDESEIRIGDAAKTLGISRSLLNTVIRRAIPEHLKPKKTHYYASGGLAYSFTNENLKILSEVLELRKSNTYAKTSDILNRKYPNESKKEEVDMKLVVNKDKNIEHSEGLINIDNKNGQLLVSSREVASNFNKNNQHINESIRDIERSVENSTHLFIPNKYKDSMNRTQNEYLLTRDGFSLLVMGFTGDKALQWKLKYIEAFNKMEEELKKRMEQELKEQSMPGNLSPELQMFEQMLKAMASTEVKQKELEENVNKVNQKVEQNAIEINENVNKVNRDVVALREVITINPKAEWRKETNSILAKIGKKLEDYSRPRVEAYEALQHRANCRPNVLVNNLKKRALENGMAPSKVDKLNLLDVLEGDTRLREIYITIVKEMAIKYL